MNATVIGSQLGDEGKGGIVDVFAGDADVVVRYQGGANAGHTVERDGETYELRLLPSGVVRGAVGVIGTGCVVDPGTLFSELDALRERGLDPDLRVDARAHVVLPHHRALDGIEEAARDEGGEAVGTTGNGIGPAYEDKAGRRGVRIGDLTDPDSLDSRIESIVSRKRRLVERVYDVDPDELGVEVGAPGAPGAEPIDPFDADAIREILRTWGDRLESEGMVVDAGAYLTAADREGKRILFEGAQGTQIDVDHGTYPYVTSSNPTVGGAISGTGAPPTLVADGHVIGVVKGYLTRVGNGPMPTELAEDHAAAVRERVGAFGTVTGRARRIGWLDLPMLRHAARVNGFTGLAITHVDTLAGFDELRLCTAYDLDGERVETVPATRAAWERCEPVYASMATWSAPDWGAVADAGYDAVPEAAREYVETVAESLSVPIVAVGVGPGREATVVRTNPLDRRDGRSDARPITPRDQSTD
ncbi:adenylosuccinate synthase [Halovivax limisalsi]|uniref:adenylosuccinate synthase n=1 Tax=Halovivax limisalsi TaxID=1453760 RepID=UPI001FFD7963|nr:adenylosuccinate synthase [Halovivax limisalsi]